jgi:hypothetical protein
MMYMLYRFLTAVVITGICAGVLSTNAGCLRVEDSPAPGCVKYIGIAPAGGCFGKSIIKGLKVEPAIETIVIEANNCNGGVLNIRNLGKQPVSLGGIDVEAGDYCIVDIQGRLGDGEYALKKSGSNFSGYIPVNDEQVVVRGRLGSREFVVSYIKTKKLCD